MLVLGENKTPAQLRFQLQHPHHIPGVAMPGPVGKVSLALERGFSLCTSGNNRIECGIA